EFVSVISGTSLFLFPGSCFFPALLLLLLLFRPSGSFPGSIIIGCFPSPFPSVIFFFFSFFLSLFLSSSILFLFFFSLSLILFPVDRLLIILPVTDTSFLLTSSILLAFLDYLALLPATSSSVGLRSSRL